MIADPISLGSRSDALQKPCQFCGGEKRHDYDRMCRACWKLIPQPLRDLIVNEPDKVKRDLLFLEAYEFLRNATGRVA